MPWPERLKKFALLIAVAALFGPLAWLLGIDPLAAIVGNWIQARDYVSVPATVESRTAQDAEGTFEYFVLRYERHGKMHETARMTVLEDDSIDERANKVVIQKLGQLPRGQAASVWVSPRMPDVAIVSRDLPWSSMWPRIPLAIGYTLLAIGAFAGALRSIAGQSLGNIVGLTGFTAIWAGMALWMFWLVLRTDEHEVPSIVKFGVLGLFALIGLLMTWSTFVAGVFGTKVDAPAQVSTRAGVTKTIRSGSSPSSQAKRGGFGQR